VTVPSSDDFRALARSSPWRWSTLRFVGRRPGQTWQADELRARVRRPDRLRVETLDGGLIQIVREDRQQIGRMTTDGGRTVELPWPGDESAPAPEFRADGLVARRPATWEVSVDDPMYQDYFWIAMLDPVELADGRDPDTLDPVGPALHVDSLTVVEHEGRPAWEAVVRPTEAYEPRCADGNCALLRSRFVDAREVEGGGIAEVLTEYPDAFRVRLDVGTGICVLTRAIGGLTPGAGHSLRIEAVDEPMPDDLFVEPRRGLFRRSGWSTAQ
jgi:hypothetical protein